MDLTSIVKTAVDEHEDTNDSQDVATKLIGEVEVQLKDLDTIPRYDHTSRQLSLVTFRCMLQDTGYPMEVYMPGGTGLTAYNEGMDMSKLKERWIGWAVEVPGEQTWVKSKVVGESNGHTAERQLPKKVHAKYPLPGNDGRYLGALVKIYDETISFRPASVHTFVGILSGAPLPSAIQDSEDDSSIIVPTIHVVQVLDPKPEPPTGDSPDIHQDVIAYLANAFQPPDRLAAELLFLSLLSSPSVRPASLPPLGTLSLNLLRKDGNITSNLEKIVSSISPRVVSQSLSLPLLHSHPFSPSSTDSTLDAGLLQLAPGTVLLVGEDEMGQGGQLQEKAVKNIRALMECAKDQTVRYEYPYMDGLKMECSIRIIVLSEGKSLIPVDINLPLAADGAATEAPTALSAFRQYLAARSSPEHARRFNIPDGVAEAIQDDFVTRRKEASAAEEGLKRRMRLARLVALSTSTATLDQGVWERTLDLDRRIEARLAPAAQS